MVIEHSNVASEATPPQRNLVNFIYDATNDLLTLTTDYPQLTKYCARFKTGTYEGDGAVSQAITGIGFTVEWVKIWVVHTSAAADQEGVYEKTDNGPTGTLCWHHVAADGKMDVIDNAIIALGTDGFTVDDAGADAAPNKNGVDYCFVVAKQ